MKPRVHLYLSNWSTYFEWRAGAKKFHKYDELSFRQKFRFQFGWASIFINMATGGDPRESTSSSLHKDRNSSWLAAALIWIIELFHANHGEIAYRAEFGEDSPDDRELDGVPRIILLVIWILILTIIINLIGRLI